MQTAGINLAQWVQRSIQRGHRAVQCHFEEFLLNDVPSGTLTMHPASVAIWVLDANDTVVEKTTVQGDALLRDFIAAGGSVTETALSNVVAFPSGRFAYDVIRTATGYHFTIHLWTDDPGDVTIAAGQS